MRRGSMEGGGELGVGVDDDDDERRGRGSQASSAGHEDR
jgi:hypothetical protein